MNRIKKLLNLLLDKKFRTILDLVTYKINTRIYLRKYYCDFFLKKNLLQILKQSDKKFTLIIDNNIGGGSRKYMNHLLNSYHDKNIILLRFYYEARNKLYYLETITDQNKKYCFTISSIDILPKYFDISQISLIFINQIISFPKPYEILSFINNMKSIYQIKITLAVHDYYVLCPSYNLINSKGAFCNIPENLSKCNACLQNPFDMISLFNDEKNIRRWRKNWIKILEKTDTILLFSESSKKLLIKTYPLIDPSKIKITPHQLDKKLKVSSYSHQANDNKKKNIVIGVLGNIIYIKGANIIKEMLEIIQATQLNIKIVIIGEFDISYRHPSLKVTGRYKEEELVSLIEKNEIDIFFVSSICPETFSYITEEILTMEYPVVSFNIGAPAERIRNYSQGYIVDTIDANAVLSTISNINNEK